MGVRAIVLAKQMHYSVRYLAWSMIFVTLTNIQLWIIFINPTGLLPNFLTFFFPFQLLSAPYLLVFVYHFLGEGDGLKKIRFWIFFPFWIFTAVYTLLKVGYFMSDLNYAEARREYFWVFKLEEVVTLIFGVIICTWIYQIILRFEQKNRDKKYDQVVSQTKWIKKILFFSFGLFVVWMLSFLFDMVSVYAIGNYAYLPSWFGYLALIIYIGYSGFKQSSILQERKILHQYSKGALVRSDFNKTSPKNATTKQYFEQLEKLMAEHKLYLNPYLDLATLSKEISISPNYLSKIVNSHSEMNFSDYLNSYRVSYAKTILLQEEFNNYNMISIAMEAGFNSKSAFYAAFNKHTNQTPGAFRDGNSS